MITTRDFATVRAALRYWQEEMCPHGEEAAQPYFDEPDVEPLTAHEIDQLRRRLGPANIRYVLFAAGEDRLADAVLFGSAAVTLQAAKREHHVATVVLPA